MYLALFLSEASVHIIKSYSDCCDNNPSKMDSGSGNDQIEIPIVTSNSSFFYSAKAVREGAVFLVVGVMPSIGNGLCLIPIDRISPIGTGGTPINGNASEVSNGYTDATSETDCRASVFLIAVAGKDFSDRSLTCRL